MVQSRGSFSDSLFSPFGTMALAGAAAGRQLAGAFVVLADPAGPERFPNRGIGASCWTLFR